MTISYNWLSEYLPLSLDPERLSKILTSIGLEVEHVEAYQNIKGGLSGLVVGEVLTCEKHPNADKLKVTTVNVGDASPLQIVCGAANVAVGQKVIVAKTGVTIHPIAGDPVTMKLAKIRSVESQGMICAEDEVGLGTSHDGILVLPLNARAGSPVKDLFENFDDTIYEIGLTPNRMDAMSHMGVARDVCAYLTHHDKKDLRVKQPAGKPLKSSQKRSDITVTIDNKKDCQRYAGIHITGVTIGTSPEWLQQRLKSIGLRPINNIVDITNFILHESGQPLHAFDADAITTHKVVVRNLPEGTPFVTLDGKERKLSAEDLVICNGDQPMCIAGVFGGKDSGVSDHTKSIFLESAWFAPRTTRRTSMRHALRTDAASRFEKGVDISNTLNVLKRAAALIVDIAGGEVAGEFIDQYPSPEEKRQVAVKYHYIKKLSGKNYHPDTVKKILESLGFEILKDGIDQLWVSVPYSKPDISLPADIVEEIIRIDGLDNIEIPTTIAISPSVTGASMQESLKQKITGYLAGGGFHEILTNSITNAAYFNEDTLATTVKMLNSLSSELNVLRPSMLPTALEAMAFNLNRKTSDLRFFEFGKTYKAGEKYEEHQHLCMYVSGNDLPPNWKQKSGRVDYYFLKGLATNILSLCGINADQFEPMEDPFSDGLQLNLKNDWLLRVGTVKKDFAARFDIKQDVFYADLNWDAVVKNSASGKVEFEELPKQLPVYRDLALIVDKSLPYQQVENAVKKARLEKLQNITLFDVFESEKLGAGKKSLAVSFTFLDPEKTLTDKEIDAMMSKIMSNLEKELQAEIRKQ
jgi:phenylalanyl-tRNA synthetase beta chain